jgi:hypothetical protein
MPDPAYAMARQFLRVWLKAARSADGGVQLRAVLCGDLINATLAEGDAAAPCDLVRATPRPPRGSVET